MQHSSSRDESLWPNPVHAWYGVGILTIAYACSFIDRTVLNLLVGPIRADLQISDTQMSLLQGIAFAFFFCIMGLPFGRMADRYSRKLIIAIGVGFWSLATAACGLARSYFELFLARVGVGVGEASLAPSAWSWISDAFPPKQRSLAIGVYTMGVNFGLGLALIVGGAVIAAFEHLSLSLPGYGALKTWQAVFIVVGLPGLVIMLLMFTIPEPKRHGLMQREGAPPDQAIPLREVARFTLERWRVFLPVYVGAGLMILFGFGIVSWVPSYFIRVFDWTAPQVGYAYGLVILLLYAPGNVAFGWFAGWLAERGYADANLRAVVIGCVCAAIPGIAAPLVPVPEIALLLWGVGGFFGACSYTLLPLVIQGITPNQMRAQNLALYLLILQLIGSGLGPTIPALLTDYVFGYDEAVGWSLLVVALIFPLLAAWVLSRALVPFRARLAEASAWT
jgi:MFS family permease